MRVHECVHVHMYKHLKFWHLGLSGSCFWYFSGYSSAHFLCERDNSSLVFRIDLAYRLDSTAFHRPLDRFS